uniref:LNS2/PITP domain-containing protein n=1 Tax=Timema monikensis TaxID=170555 RepID=A0A7R9EDB4_9NEOP|nr:unnamed protein product [Timema monikensis]
MPKRRGTLHQRTISASQEFLRLDLRAHFEEKKDHFLFSPLLLTTLSETVLLLYNRSHFCIPLYLFTGGETTPYNFSTEDYWLPRHVRRRSHRRVASQRKPHLRNIEYRVRICLVEASASSGRSVGHTSLPQATAANGYLVSLVLYFVEKISSVGPWREYLRRLLRIGVRELCMQMLQHKERHWWARLWIGRREQLGADAFKQESKLVNWGESKESEKDMSLLQSPFFEDKESSHCYMQELLKIRICWYPATLKYLESLRQMQMLMSEEAFHAARDYTSSWAIANMPLSTWDDDMRLVSMGISRCMGDVTMSLCGGLNQYSVPSEKSFCQHQVTYEGLNKNPDLLENPDLVVRFCGKYLSWKAAAPQIISVLLFHKHLPQSSVFQWGRKNFFYIIIFIIVFFVFSQSTIDLLTATHIPLALPASKEIEPVSESSRSYSWFSWRRKLDYNTMQERESCNTLHERGKEGYSASESSLDSNMGFVQGINVPIGHNNHHFISKQYRKTLRLSSEQIASLNLQDGPNDVTFSVTTAYQGTTRCQCHIYKWHFADKIVISDIDGTITNGFGTDRPQRLMNLLQTDIKYEGNNSRSITCVDHSHASSAHRSDVLGHLFAIVGKDWAQIGVAQLFTKIKNNGYKLLYLSARAIGINPPRWRSWLTRLSCLARLLRTGRSRFESRSGELGMKRRYMGGQTSDMRKWKETPWWNDRIKEVLEKENKAFRRSFKTVE